MNPHFFVLKFGGSILRKRDDFDLVAAEINALLQSPLGEQGRVIAVMSAMHGVTDLKHCDRQQFPGPERATDFVLHVAQGEAESCDNVGHALDELGVRSWTLGATETGIHTRSNSFDADPESFDPTRVMGLFDEYQVVIVPGHIGQDCVTGSPTLLGRGGSDMTAVMIAHRLEACCRLYKDVAGVLDRDGARIERLSWDAFDRLESLPIQEKAAAFCREHNLSLELGSLGATEFSVIG